MMAGQAQCSTLSGESAIKIKKQQLRNEKTKDLLDYMYGRLPPNDGQMYRCVKCDFKTPSRGLFRQHVVLQHAKPFTCTECDFKSGTAKRVMDHYILHHIGVEPYLCNLCHRGYAASEALFKHMKKVHHILDKTTRYALSSYIPDKHNVLTARKAEKIQQSSVMSSGGGKWNEHGDASGRGESYEDGRRGGNYDGVRRGENYENDRRDDGGENNGGGRWGESCDDGLRGDGSESNVGGGLCKSGGSGDRTGPLDMGSSDDVGGPSSSNNRHPLASTSLGGGQMRAQTHLSSSSFGNSVEPLVMQPLVRDQTNFQSSSFVVCSSSGHSTHEQPGITRRVVHPSSSSYTIQQPAQPPMEGLQCEDNSSLVFCKKCSASFRHEEHLLLHDWAAHFVQLRDIVYCNTCCRGHQTLFGLRCHYKSKHPDKVNLADLAIGIKKILQAKVATSD